MKKNAINITDRLTGVAVALALFASVVSVNAQNGARGGASKLLQLTGSLVTLKPGPSDYKPMACALCKNTTVAVRDTELKGLGAKTLVAGGPATKLVSAHDCKGCGTDWATVGVGRAKQSVAMHKCTSCGAESLACCNTKKTGDAATKGMEKLELAPLK